MPKKRLTREMREQQIVEGAIRYFAEVGFDGQTRELARQLGMAQSLLFKYFPTKQDLIDRVYREVYLARWNPYWEGLLSDSGIPLRQRLLRFYQDYAQRIMDYEWIRIFLYAGLRGSEINNNYLELLKSRIICRICHAVREEVGLPKVADKDLSERQLQLVWSLQGTILYLAIQRHVYGNLPAVDVADIVTDRIDAFLRGVPSVFGKVGTASVPAAKPLA